MSRCVTAWIALLACALLLLGQVAFVTHSSTEQHSVCDEHGEVVHGAGEEDAVAASDTAVDVVLLGDRPCTPGVSEQLLPLPLGQC